MPGSRFCCDESQPARSFDVATQDEDLGNDPELAHYAHNCVARNHSDSGSRTKRKLHTSSEAKPAKKEGHHLSGCNEGGGKKKGD